MSKFRWNWSKISNLRWKWPKKSIIWLENVQIWSEKSKIWWNRNWKCPKMVEIGLFQNENWVRCLLWPVYLAGILRVCFSTFPICQQLGADRARIPLAAPGAGKYLLQRRRIPQRCDPSLRYAEQITQVPNIPELAVPK